jgi:PAS domain S-box-containing protein
LYPSIGALRLMGWGLVVVYAIMVALFATGETTSAVGLPSSTAMLVVFLAAVVSLRWWTPSPRVSNAITGVSALTILANITLNYIGSGEPTTAGMFLLFALGAAGMIVHTGWALLALGSTFAAWAFATFVYVPHDDLARDGGVLAAALCVGLVIHVARTRALRRTDALRRRAERRSVEVSMSLEALEKSQASLRSLIDQNPDGMAVVRDGDLLFVNEALARALRVEDPAEPTGTFAALAVAEDRPRVASMLEAGQRAVENELRFRRRDGEIIIVDVASNEIDWDGVPATLVTVRDVTDRHRELQAQLMASDRLLSVGRLAAGVAHEINNPLSYALESLRALDRDLRGMPASRARLGEALEGTQRVAAIVQDLRTFSRADEQSVDVVDLRQLLEASVRMTRSDFSHHATLEWDFVGKPCVAANEARLGQVFINLIINALQAMDDDGSRSDHVLTIACYRAGEEAVVEIRDTGCGMNEQVRSQIFEPFFTTKPVGFGTGLGLHYCHTVVTALGGRIDVASQPDRGSVFTVTLPAAASKRRERPRSDSQRFSLPKMRILIIDDEPRVARALARLLGRHDVTVMNDGREGISAYLRDRHDAIVCDMMMPGVDGADVYARIAEAAPGDERRIVFVTGAAFSGRARAFLESVDNPIVEKPFDPIELRRALGRIADGSSQRSTAPPGRS